NVSKVEGGWRRAGWWFEGRIWTSGRGERCEGVRGRADPVARKRKTAAKRPRATGTRTRPRTRVRTASRDALEQKLEARTRELAQARKELRETLDQRTATSEALRGISRST